MPVVLPHPFHCQHGIIRAFLQGRGLLDDRKAKMCGVGKFLVLLILMHVLPGMISGCIGNDLAILGIPRQEKADMRIKEGIWRRVQLLLCLPEGMCFRKGQSKEGFHAPIRGPGRIVSLCRTEIGIAISYRQDMVPVKDRHFHPGPQIG